MQLEEEQALFSRIEQKIMVLYLRIIRNLTMSNIFSQVWQSGPPDLDQSQAVDQVVHQVQKNFQWDPSDHRRRLWSWKAARRSKNIIARKQRHFLCYFYWWCSSWKAQVRVHSALVVAHVVEHSNMVVNELGSSPVSSKGSFLILLSSKKSFKNFSSIFPLFRLHRNFSKQFRDFSDIKNKRN